MDGYDRAGLAFAVSLLLAAGNWIALSGRRRTIGWLLKPGAQLAVVVAAWMLTAGPHDEWQARFFVPGLAVCLVGDILLMFPGPGFLAGLAAFLLGHTCYTAGLNPSPPPPASLAFAAAAFAASLALYRAIARGLRRTGQRALLGPVAAYTAVICVMLSTAWATLLRPEWSPARRALVVGGASLFAASDAMLAWDRFVSPSRSGPLRVMITYHLAQMALAASISLV